MTPVRTLLLVLSCVLSCGTVVLASAEDEPVRVDICWTASPDHDEDGNPLAPAVMYRVYASRDDGPASYMCQVNRDTLCTLSLERGSVYRVRVVGFDDRQRASVPSEFSDPIYYAPGGDLTDVGDLLVRGATIESAFPNPFNPLVCIRYAVGQQNHGAPLLIDVLDVRGHRVASLYSGRQAAGRHEVTWDGTDDSGLRLPSGAYFVRLVGPSGPQVHPVTMVK